MIVAVPWTLIWIIYRLLHCAVIDIDRSGLGPRLFEVLSLLLQSLRVLLVGLDELDFFV